MTDKPTNEAGEPAADEQEPLAEDAASETPDEPTEAAGEGAADEEDIPVEVDVDDDSEAGALADAEADEPAGAEPGGLSHADLLELVGQAETEKGALAQQVAELEQRVEALEGEKKETYERLLRSAADMENLRKRTRKDVEDARIDARSRVLKEMLPVIDNLERAVEHAEKSGEGDAGGIMEGVQLVLRQFGQALERCEAKPVEAKGLPFDPNLHEAVSQIESPDHDAGTVVEELQRGYTIGSRLLRASLVVVASASSRPAPEPEAEPAEAAEATDDEAAASADEPSDEVVEDAASADETASDDEPEQEG